MLLTRRTPWAHVVLAMALLVYPATERNLSADQPAGAQTAKASVSRPVMPADVAKRVEALEERIFELRAAGLAGDDKAAQDAALDGAITLAEEVLALRRQHQSAWTNTEGDPAEWYEITDARRMVEDLRRLAMLASEQRAEVAEADSAESRFVGLHGRGDYAAALVQIQRALKIRRRVLGGDHPDTLTLINDMGHLLMVQGKLAEAEPYHREALEGRRQVLGGDHPSTLMSIGNMGVLLSNQGKLAEAEPYYREALEGKRRVLGDDHAGTLTSISNMGVLFVNQGELGRAEPYLHEVLKVKRRVLGDDHPDTLVAISNMGGLLQAQAKLAEAEALHREVLERRRRVLGDDHPSTLISSSNLGALLCRMGKAAEAEPYCREALEGNRRILGDDHPSTLTSVNNMGMLLNSQGRLAEAEAYCRAASEGYRRVLGDDHPETLSSIINVGDVLEAQGKLAEAEPLYREGLEGRRRVLGVDHPDTLSSMNSLGVLLHVKGKLAEAESLYREGLEGRRRVLGDDHPETLSSIGNVGCLLESRGRLVEAEPYHRDGTTGSRRVLGNDHPGTLTSISNMGMFLKAQGKLVEAELCLREALEGRHRVLGDDHPDTLKSINEMGYVLLDQGELAEAERYFREALEIAERLRTRVIGDEHNRAAYAGKLRLRETAAVLSSLLTETNRFDRAWSVAERGRARALLDLLTRDDRNLIEQARARADKAGESAAIETLEVALTAEQSANIDLTTAEALLAGIQKQRARTEARDDLPDDEKGTRLAKLDQRIAEQHAKVKSLRRGLDEASAKVFAELRGLFPDAKPLPIEEILARLAPGELLLGYTWIGDSVQLLVAEAPGHTGTGTVSRATDESTGQGSVRGYLLAKGEDEVAELTELARNVRNLLVDRNSDASSEVIGGLLAKLIPEEIRTRVQSAERLIVLPDGPLNGIPFDALRPQSAVKSVAAGDGQLGDRPLLGHGTQIVYAASATMYLNRKGLGDSGIEGLRGKMTAVALGDPIFDRDAPPEPDYPEQGVLVSMVVEGTNADKAGLQRGDVVLSYAQQKTPDYDTLVSALGDVVQQVQEGQREADERVPVTYWRDDQTHNTTLAPGKMGVHLDKGSPADALRALARSARGYENQAADISATDQMRLFGGKLNTLPGTGEEATAIARIVRSAGGEAELLVGEDATIAKLDQAAAGRQFLHLATHGLTGSVERPYDASLALTRPRQITPADIGFLRLSDLITHWRGKLAGCDLVVLSACDTQLGVKKGDSVMALPWGFFYAGAPTVIASLWKVDDTATMLLMVRLYENLLGQFESPRAGFDAKTPMPKAAALQEAQHWLRGLTYEQVARLTPATTGADTLDRSGERRRRDEPTSDSDRPYEHPYYWAAFILIGDPE